MAQDPNKPKDDGKIKLPPVDAGMNKITPNLKRGGRGSKNDGTAGKPAKKKRVSGEQPREPGQPPPLSASSEPDPPDLDLDADEPADMKGAKAEKILEGEEKEALLSRVRKRMDRCIQAESENRKSALEDLKFKSGDQWPADVAAQRNFDKRPCLTINKLPTFVHQITNDQRQNRPSINISPVGDRGDVDVAKMYRGLIRAIERACSADIAYDTAFDNAVSNGFGYWRILTEFESHDTFNQVIVVKRIRNPFTVYLDPDHQEPDGADCTFGFVSEMIPRDEFKEKWPKADEMPFTQSGIGESLKNWISADTIRIAEYFEISYTTRKLIGLSNGHVGWEDELSDTAVEMMTRGEMTILNERDAEVPKITWYKLTAKDILEQRNWPGRWIPIVKVIGDEIDVEGKVKYSGIIRFSRDAQRMYNYWKTSETELIALAPKAPWIMEEGQVEGHEAQWKQANTKSYPYLLYKASNAGGAPAPAPQRQQFAGVPAGVVNASQGAAQDMMATTGIRFDSTQQERMIDESGKAIRALTQRGELGAFHFTDNLARSLRHTGRIFCDLIPKIYDAKRTVTILREDDTEERVQIDPSQPKPIGELQQGPMKKAMRIFNPTYGEYGVTVDIGPSFATKRIEAAESMMAFAKALPNTAALIADLIAKNQDWPGAEEMAARLAKAVPPQLLTPNQKDVPPQIQALMQSMDGQIKALGQERQRLIAMLTEKASERAVEQDKINKDFEAKLLAIVQKAEASFNTHIASEIRALGENVGALRQALENPAAAPAGGEKPAAQK